MPLILPGSKVLLEEQQDLLVSGPVDDPQRDKIKPHKFFLLLEKLRFDWVYNFLDVRVFFYLKVKFSL